MWTAIAKGATDQAMIQFLLDNGARIGVRADAKGTALTLAASDSTIELMQTLLMLTKQKSKQVKTL